MRLAKVLYSIGVRFAAGGIGDVAYHGVSGLYRRGMLRRLLCGSRRETDIPDELISQMGLLSRGLRRLALHDPSGTRVSNLHNALYDRWAHRQLEPCDVFLSWNGFGLAALQRARAAGAVTIVYRASSHPREQARLIREERARWGVGDASDARHVALAVAEMHEADYVLIPSDFVRHTCLEEGIAPDKLIQIPFGVDIDRFHPAVQMPPEKPFKVVFVGQIGLRKGVPYLLEAWKKLAWDDAELCIVGLVQAEFEPWFRPHIGMPGVVMPGYVHDLAEFLRQYHLFVFPTIEEGSALAVYEAMATGLPVITTPNAGSLIRHERDGLIVPVRDSTLLAEQMARLRDDAPLRARLGKAARKRIEPYTWQRYGDALATEMQNRSAHA